MRVLAMVVPLLLILSAAGHAEVAGGGLANTDCRMVFSGVTATNGSSGVVCRDGDPTCDEDGAEDGTCHFSVAVCTGSPTAGCSTTPFTAITMAGLDLVPPDVPAPDGTCGPSLDVAVPVGTASGATGRARDSASLRDVDYVDLCCVSSTATALDAARCAVEVSLPVTGCPTRKIPRRARTAFARARALVDSFSDAPAHRRDLDKALGRFAIVRRAGQRLATQDECGDALGLVASYAADAVSAAKATAPPGS